MSITTSMPHVKVADEVWIAAALLHRENPQRTDFTVNEILEKVRQEQIAPELRPGVRVHALQHCVANKAPNPGRYRMLYATGRLTRRLFRKGDAYHPAREGSKMIPEKSEIPPKYHYLLEWYVAEYSHPKGQEKSDDSILELRGLGKEVWRDVDPDEYVRRLREGWE